MDRERRAARRFLHRVALPIFPLVCRLIGHRRSRRRAFFDRDQRRWGSYCRICGTPMVRHGFYGWRDRSEAERLGF